MELNRIVVVGSLNMDLVVKTLELPRLGETISGQDFHTIPGGKGANQAVAAGKLGASVCHVGRVGRDGFGDALLASLQAAGVDTTCVEKLDGIPTGVALITVDAVGDNTIVVVPGANGQCGPEFVTAALGRLEGDVLVCQLEIPLESVLAAAEVAKEKDMLVVLNPAPAAPLPAELMQCVDILILNETETEVITGIQVTDVASAMVAGRAILGMGVQQVVLTLGKNGSVHVSAEKEVHVPAFSVKSVDTTAAGDAFIGALAAFITKTKDVEDALTIASAAGALAVTRLGAQSSLPTLDEVTAFLRDRGRGDAL